MGFILDAIRRKVILDEPETVNVDWSSSSFSLDDRESEFSISINYENGVGFSGNLILQVSNDDVTFADIIESSQSVTDNSGMHIWDISGSGALYARVKIEVASGSVDVSKIHYVAKQRH